MNYLQIVLNKACQSKETQLWLEPYIVNARHSDHIVMQNFYKGHAYLTGITLFDLVIHEIADPIRMQEILCEQFDYSSSAALFFTQNYGSIFTLTIPNECNMIYVRPLSVDQCEIKIL